MTFKYNFCNNIDKYFRLYNGKAAETELKQISSEQHTFGQDLVKHNLVVFRNGEGALKVCRSYTCDFLLHLQT